MKPTVLDRARRYIAKCPPAVSGQGGHNTTFHVASVLVHGFALVEADGMALLREWNGSCRPPWSEAELVHKVKSAASAKHHEQRGYLLGNPVGAGVVPGRMPQIFAKRKSAPCDPVIAVKKFLKGFQCSEVDLGEASPIKLDRDVEFDAPLLVKALYAPGELVNFVTEYRADKEKSDLIKARPVGMGMTLECNALVARFEQQGTDSSQAGGWLRMNPVDGRGIADANVTAHRFALLESDKLSLELQASLFVKMPLPIAAVLSSGGRSLHAWVKVDALDADEYRTTVGRMLELLATFGMDTKNKNPSRLSRLPGARRVIGSTGDGFQRLLYLNPQPSERSIF